MCAGVILGAWGGTTYGSVVGSGIDCADPRPLNTNRRQRRKRIAKHVKVTESCFLALTEDGRVFQQGGEAWSDEEQLVLAREEDPVVEIAAGRGHMVALCESGRVFTWGDNTAGQCGQTGARQGQSEYIHEPQQLAYFTSLLQKNEGLKVVRIACGSRSTIAVTKNGHVFAFGGGGVGVGRRGGSGGGRGADDVPSKQWPNSWAPKRVRGVKVEGACHVASFDDAFFLVTTGDNEEERGGHDDDVLRKLSLGTEKDSAALAAAEASSSAGAAATTVAAAASAAAAATAALGKGGVGEGESLVVRCEGRKGKRERKEGRGQEIYLMPPTHPTLPYKRWPQLTTSSQRYKGYTDSTKSTRSAS